MVIDSDVTEYLRHQLALGLIRADELSRPDFELDIHDGIADLEQFRMHADGIPYPDRSKARLPVWLSRCASAR